MSKQQKTYVLLAAVFIVWGGIGYQIISKLSPSVDNEKLEEASRKFVPQEVAKEVSYTIEIGNRDPFFGKMEKPRIVKKKSVEQTKPMTNKPFPYVVYNGLVENGKSKSYILTIDGSQEVMSLGKTIKEITLLRANKKEILVRYHKETKTVGLQE